MKLNVNAYTNTGSAALAGISVAKAMEPDSSGNAAVERGSQPDGAAILAR